MFRSGYSSYYQKYCCKAVTWWNSNSRSNEGGKLSVLWGCDAESLGISFGGTEVVLSSRIMRSDDLWRCDHCAVAKHWVPNTQWHSVTSQKNLYLIHKAEKNHEIHMAFLSLLLFMFLNFQMNWIKYILKCMKSL